MNDIRWSWDEKECRLERFPKMPMATREETMSHSKDIELLMGADSVARETAKYRQAIGTWDNRDLFQPITEVPGPPMPAFLRSHDRDTYARLRQGLKALSRGQTKALQDDLVQKYTECAEARALNDWVRRFSTCEAHNASCIRPLGMAVEWLTELNPEGDADKIHELRSLLREWYGIEELATPTAARHAQGEWHAKNPDWLSPVWREVWGSP